MSRLSWWARGWWGMVALVTLTGCCGATLGDGSRAVIADHVKAWKLAGEYAKAAGWPNHGGLAGLPADDVEPETPSWWRRYVAWTANALMLQAKAEGRTLTLAEATAQAEHEVPR